MSIKVVQIRLLHNDGPVKAFADIEIEPLGLIIRDFAVLRHQDSHKTYIQGPRSKWTGPDGKIKQKSILFMPRSLKQAVELAILAEFTEAERRRRNETNP
ncbi:MAG: hypothetical protein GTN76_15440 [Candidatus Aenigmarchaeota archaeon]|nr:hypothetical protein [Candidatus Aenigmarchaeota archaeon]